MQIRSQVSTLFKKPLDEKSEPEKRYAEEIKAYEAAIAEIEKERKEPVSSLERHVLPFLNPDDVFSGSTITDALTAMHGSMPGVKGPLISTFNATHGSENWALPSFSAKFIKDKNGFARFLHLGTTRIWNDDGSINEERMVEFKKIFPEKVSQSGLNAYLAECMKKDPPTSENGSHRNADAKFGLTTKKMREEQQASAATQAWGEVFDRLACGWVQGPSGKPERYLTIDIAEEFFRDSPRAFLRAKCGLLPVVKPEEPVVRSSPGVCPYRSH